MSDLHTLIDVTDI